MGYAAVQWFEKGEKLSGQAIKNISIGMTTNMLAILKDLGKHKPDQEGLREHITQSLADSSMAESISAFELETGK
jgi:hypothetical protein